MASKIPSTFKLTDTIGYIIVLSIIIVVLGAIVYVYKAQQVATNIPESQITQPPLTGDTVPTPTPTPTKLFHGKDTYNISGGMPDDPHFPEVSIDPLDPEVGQEQTFTVKITSKYPVTTAYLSIRTDKNTTKLPLTLSSDDRTNAIWTATWKMPETYLYNYQITPHAQTAYTQSSATITVRERK